MGKLLVGLCLMVLMLCRPEAAANGAREGLCHWYYAVAPSLFPFMALMPLLTCSEANHFYNMVLGGAMRGLFGLPGSAASPMVVGMLAGSPAGCVAARAVAVEEGYTRGQLERVAMACCGLSPAFFVSAIGAGMLGNVGMGHVLLRSQLLTQLFLLALTRCFCADDSPIEAARQEEAANPVLSILNVAGYMALFGAIAGTCGIPWIQLVLDITAGSRLICDFNLEIRWKLVALSALAGYGGLCICFQNIGILRDVGIKPVKFMLVRGLAMLLCPIFTMLQLKIKFKGIPSFNPKIMSFSCIIALIIAIPVIFRLRKTIF